MSADAFDIEEWLGAEVSGKFLPDKVQISLKKSFDDKAWDEMFPPRGRDACPSAHPAPGLKHPGAEKTTFACKLMHGCSSQSDCPRAQSPRREKRNPSSCNGPSFVRTFQHALSPLHRDVAPPKRSVGLRGVATAHTRWSPTDAASDLREATSCMLRRGRRAGLGWQATDGHHNSKDVSCIRLCATLSLHSQARTHQCLSA